MKLPYFPFYPQDWAGDPKVLGLTLEERGAYISLMCAMWNYSSEGNCSVPDDESYLARILGVGTEKWRQLRAVLVDGPAAVIHQEGATLFCPRLRKEWLAAKDKSEKAAKSAGQRWQSGGNANAMRTHSDGNANQIQTQNQKTLDAIASNGAPAPPSVRSYQGCLATLKGSTNPNATMRDLLQELYGVAIPDSSIGRIGAGIKKVGAGKFFEVAWNAVKGWPGVDDPLDWIAGALKKVEADAKTGGRLVDTSENARGENYAELVLRNGHNDHWRTDEEASPKRAARESDDVRVPPAARRHDARNGRPDAPLSILR